MKQRFAAGMTSLGLASLELPDVDEDTEVYVSVRPAELSELQKHISSYLDSVQANRRPSIDRDRAVTGGATLERVRSEPPLAIWSEGMDQWMSISTADMQDWNMDTVWEPAAGLE
eukprot:COSAG02_NODE_33784_length_494_cov_1.258228_1_plen_114_part_01